MKIEAIQAAALADSNIIHGFFTKNGGVSGGIYSSLNTGLGSKDQHTLILENRRRVAENMQVPEKNLLTVNQIHSTEVVEVQECWSVDAAPQADGLVTNKPGIALAICTADCGPVLFADKINGIIGATHAGWRGAINGILEHTISIMESLGAKRTQITASLGPTISANAYEVGSEFVEQFLTQTPANETFFQPATKPNHSMFDLPAYIVNQLNHAGIGTVSNIDQCTYSHPETFYSYRRMLHNNEQDYGRLMSAIAIKK